MKKHVLVIYHSQGGNTEKLAQACFVGAKNESDVEVKILKAFDTSLEDLIWADGVIIGTPEYFGNMSGAVKDFFDRTYYPARKININKPYALFIACEGDGSGAARNVESLTSSYTLRKSLDTILAKDADMEANLKILEEMGNTFASGLAMGIF